MLVCWCVVVVDLGVGVGVGVVVVVVFAHIEIGVPRGVKFLWTICVFFVFPPRHVELS